MPTPVEPIVLAEVQYPAMLWVSRYRAAVPAIATIVPIAAGGALAVSGCGNGWLVGGIVVGALTWGVARLAVELICLLVETLIPQ